MVMGNLNTRTAALHLNIKGQPPRQSTDTMINTWGCALLTLLEKFGLLLLNGALPHSANPTSLGTRPGHPLCSVVDYTLASRATVPWLDGLSVEHPNPQLSDHYPLMLTLSLPGPPGGSAPTPQYLSAGNLECRPAGANIS